MITKSARPTGTGAPGYAQTLPRTPAAAGRARLLVSTALSAWGKEELGYAGSQIVSELINNAVTHTRSSAIQVVISRDLNRVRIGVVDRNQDTPTIRYPDENAESGRGLLLVAALSAAWGYERKPWGKVVWAELAGEGN
ncbi:ATP-binding protein [Streptomyces sp. NPDC058000]|uniref:ATP-binding protein n=1 Tax=Streptomyces sp. NPDC058000 TaxID=3346299 RepID=UPI0036E77C5C